MTDPFLDTKELNRFLGLHFRLLRLSKGVSADAVAERCGKSKAQIYRLETGQSWRVTDWYALSSAVDSPGDLATDHLRELLHRYRSGDRAPERMPFPPERD